MNKYDDIIGFPHYEPKHPRMPLENRAAQFAPFSALNGHSAAITETARLTEDMMELSVEDHIRLSRRLNMAYERQWLTKITCFIPDQVKNGGKYESFHGVIKKIDHNERIVYFHDGRLIPIDFISDIFCDTFDETD